MTENWLPVVGYEGTYEVSDLGRVRSLTREIPCWWGMRPIKGRVLKPFETDKVPYLRVGLTGPDGKQRKYRVHRLVLLAFVGEPEPGQEVRHVDGDSQNNHLSNLEWGTKSTNTLDQVAMGRHHMERRTHCPKGHPYNDENTYVRPDRKGRGCKECRHLRATKAAA